MGARTESRTWVRRPLQKARWAMMRPWAREIGIEAVLDTLKGKEGHLVVDEMWCTRQRGDKNYCQAPGLTSRRGGAAILRAGGDWEQQMWEQAKC